MQNPFQSSFKSLSLHNFRNHTFLKLPDLPTSPIVITGQNGIGKTNILEAASLISSSKGLRGAKIAELNNQARSDLLWQIIAEARTVYGLKEIVTTRQVKANSTSETRTIHIDGSPIKKKAEVSELLKIIWLTPPMQQIFMGSTSARRTFFDQIVSNFFTEHPSHLSKYEKSMRDRLKLLKDKTNDIYWLSALENNMFNEASIISHARMKTLSILNSIIQKNDTSFPKSLITLINEPTPADLANRLKLNRNLDAATGRTNLGPHNYDLEVIYQHKNMPAKFCSTGEQKALLLNIILAQAYAIIEQFKVIPVMLFDEVISHLDNNNRALLFDELNKLNAQSWLTGIDPKSFELIKHSATFINL